MNKYYIYLIVAILTGLAATPAGAVQWKGMTITPRVAVDETYDSNITTVKHGAISDMKTDLTLGLNLLREGKTSDLSLDAAIDRQMFADNNDFDSTAIDLNARYRAELSKYDRIDFQEKFSRSDSFTTFADAFGATNGLYTRDSNYLSTAYFHDVNTQLTWQARYSNNIIKDTREGQSDFTADSFGTGLDYSLSSANILSADYTFTHYALDPGPSAEKHDVAAKFRHFLTQRLYFDLQSGVDLLEDYAGKSRVRPIYHAALIQDVDTETRIALNFDKWYTPSTSSPDVFNNWQLSGNLSKQLKERLKGLLTVFYGEGKYVTSGNQEAFAGIDSGFDYELTKKAVLRLGYSFSTKNTTNGDGDYNRNVVYSGATIKF